MNTLSIILDLIGIGLCTFAIILISKERRNK